MKKILILSLALIVSGASHAQQRNYSTFYYQRASLFEALPASASDIVFLGNSITNGGEWCELFGDARVKNRGISGDISQGVYDRLDPIVAGRPAKIFLMIGVNDIARGLSPDTIAANIRRIVLKIKSKSPRTKIYLQSVLPVNDAFGMFRDHTLRGAEIVRVNNLLVKLAAETGTLYIDLHTPFSDADGKLKPEYTNDGLHLLGPGYILWRDTVAPYVKE